MTQQDQQLQILSTIALLLLVLIAVFKQDKIDRFLNFGSKTSVIENFKNTVNENINKSFLSVSLKCQNDSQMYQNMEFDCPTTTGDDTAKMYIACLNAGGAPETCNEVRYSCDISDIKQDLVVSFKQQCKIDNDMVTKMKDDLKDRLKKVEDSNTWTDTFAPIGQGIGKAIGDGVTFGNSSTKTTNKEKTINRIVNMVDKKFLNELSSKLFAKQDLVVKGNAKVKAVSQKAQIDVVSDLTSNNNSMNEMISWIDMAVDEKTTSDGPFKFISDMFGSLTNAAIALGGCCFCCLCIIGIVFFATGGQETVKYGINKAATYYKPPLPIPAV